METHRDVDIPIYDFLFPRSVLQRRVFFKDSFIETNLNLFLDQMLNYLYKYQRLSI